MHMKKVRIRDSAKTKSDILRVAEDEFAQKGFYGARVDEIAALADINKRMIYEYYTNKEGLYKAVLFNVYRRLEEKEVEILTTDDDCIETIRNIIRMYYKFLRDNPNFVSILLWENLNKAQYMSELDTSQIKDPSINLMRQTISKGKREGIFRSDVDEEQVILSLITFSFSYFSNRYTLSKLLSTDLCSETALEKRVKHVTEILLKHMCV